MVSTRRKVAFCEARFPAGLEVGGQFGVPQLVTINKSANYGVWRNLTRDFLDVSTLSVCEQFSAAYEMRKPLEVERLHRELTDTR
jgi:hypothetical protein